jgi:hypothetical protein
MDALHGDLSGSSRLDLVQRCPTVLKKFTTNVATGGHFSKIDQISILLGNLYVQLLCSTNNTLSTGPFLTLKVSLNYNKYSKIQTITFYHNLRIVPVTTFKMLVG